MKKLLIKHGHVLFENHCLIEQCEVCQNSANFDTGNDSNICINSNVIDDAIYGNDNNNEVDKA